MVNMMNQPLRYKISQWPQAVKCLSNNSRNLYISVNDFVNNDALVGQIIKVEHTQLGTLFACLIKGSGQIVSEYDNDGNIIPWLSTPEILWQLKRFGFDIVYKEISSLDDETLSHLMRIRDAGYDKITRLTVKYREDGILKNRIYTVAMKSKENDDLLVYGMSVGQVKFNNRLASGKMMSLEDISSTWTWLDSIYNIEDILQENADIEKFTPSEPQDEPIMICPEGFTEYTEYTEDISDSGDASEVEE